MALPCWFPELRSWLEVAAFAATVAFCYAAFRGLRQLTYAREELETAKKEIRTRFRREAITLTLQQCERFQEKVIPKIQALMDRANEANLEFVDWELRDTEFGSNSIVDKKRADAWLEAYRNIGTWTELSGILNAFEVFAMYFEEGAADEEAAFKPVAAVFCREVEALAPMLVYLRTEKDSTLKIGGPFSNTISLYQRWIAKQEHRDLRKKATGLGVTVSGDEPRKPPIGVGG